MRVRVARARIAFSLSEPTSKHGRDFDSQGLLAPIPAMPSPVTLPTATIQDDFTTVLSEVHAGVIPSENVWLSCYKHGEPSVHGKIAVSLHEKDRDRVELVGTGGVELTRTSQVSHSKFRAQKTLIDPRSIVLSSADFGTPWCLRFGTTVQLVQVHRPLFGTWDRFCGFHLFDRGIRGPITLGRETCESCMVVRRLLMRLRTTALTTLLW